MSKIDFKEVNYLNQLKSIDNISIELNDVINLSKYNKIWFTSDEHYGSQRALELSKRLEFMPNNISKMNNHIINCHNQRVGDDDLVIHLGDFGLFNYMTQLNGHHILIEGNYENDDPNFMDHLLSPGVRDKLLLVSGLSCVNDNIYIGNKTLLKYFSSDFCEKIQLLYLAHKPEDCILPDTLINTIEDDYKPYKLITNGKYIMNLFGHIHEKAKIKPYGLNVGVDCHHYYPFSVEEIEFYLMAIIEHYDQNVFM